MAEAARFGMDALVEVHDEAEMARAARLGADPGGRQQPRPAHLRRPIWPYTERLAAAAPPGALLVTESGIFTPADVATPGGGRGRAMLVGESLMRQADVCRPRR